MPIKLPSKNQIKQIADGLGMDLNDDDLSSFKNIYKKQTDLYNVIDRMPDYLPTVKYPRTPGYKPVGEENKYNAWHIKTEVHGNSQGKLKGRRVVLKDNIMLAGVPMMNGASTLEGYMPEIDATVVTRLLDAGATIVGKAHCEYFCLSGGSHTCAAGPVHNPHKMGYMAGGSSSGSAALVAAGEVEMAIGGDQGGSIRMPASYCGIYGMKPTHGLVPYTGIMPIEIYIDHTGPMTQNVEDNALMLEVIAGADGLDPRQYSVKTHEYTKALQGKDGIKGMKIAVVKEGFNHENTEPDVDEVVQDALEKMKSMGALVKEVSIPMHSLGTAIWLPIGMEGQTQTMMYGDGYGTSRPDLYVTSLMDFHRGWRSRTDELAETVKFGLLWGTYVNSNHGNKYYGKAMNLSRMLKDAYDKVLSEYDLLAMPTTVLKSQPIPKTDASREEIIQRGFEMNANTCPFDITHHPAIAIPCGKSEGLPVSLQLVGKHYDEPSLYRAAHAFQEFSHG